jgi:hypothetical protein
MRLWTYYLQRSATECPSTCHFIHCLHNLLNLLVQIANKMEFQGRGDPCYCTRKEDTRKCSFVGHLDRICTMPVTYFFSSCYLESLIKVWNKFYHYVLEKDRSSVFSFCFSLLWTVLKYTSWNSGQILGVIYYLVVKTKLYTYSGMWIIP